MKAVIDTVVFVRALINPHSRSGRLLFTDLLDRYTVVLSAAIIEEILDVVFRPILHSRFPQMASPPHVQAILELIQGAEVVEPAVVLHVCRDPSDDKFLECAMAGSADCVVTEDLDLLDLRQFEGIKLLTVAEFVKLLETEVL